MGLVKPDTGQESDSELLVGFSPGSVIYSAGDQGNEMFVVEEGEVELVSRFGPKERRLALLGPGDFFGEMSLLEGEPRAETARAVSECRLLAVDPAAFDQLLRHHPEATLRMIRKLSRRLHDLHEAEQRAQETAAGVLAGARADQEELQPIATPAGSEEIAAASLYHVASGMDFPLATDRKNVIGRADPVTGLDPEVDLTPLDGQRSLSRRHACIWWQDGKVLLREEVGAANGTFVDHERLASGEERAVAAGAHLRFGLVEMVLRPAPDERGSD